MNAKTQWLRESGLDKGSVEEFSDFRGGEGMALPMFPGVGIEIECANLTPTVSTVSDIDYDFAGFHDSGILPVLIDKSLCVGACHS